MKTVIRNIVAKTYKPILEKYLSRTRNYKYEDISLEIPPEVFHPGFFFSTKFLLNALKELPLSGKQLLEPGCGSGLISIYAAKKGAVVTASDINQVAIETVKNNAATNKVKVEVVKSDLFQELPQREYDLIVINPPYYKKQPLTDKDLAWQCGENGEYFEVLFKSLANYIHDRSIVLMVLFEGCDLEMIKRYASANYFRLNCIRSQKNFLETNFIFRIEKTK